MNLHYDKQIIIKIKNKDYYTGNYIETNMMQLLVCSRLDSNWRMLVKPSSDKWPTGSWWWIKPCSVLHFAWYLTLNYTHQHSSGATLIFQSLTIHLNSSFFFTYSLFILFTFLFLSILSIAFIDCSIPLL